MTARSLILVLSALLTAGGTAFFARNLVTADRAQMSVPATVPPPEPAHAVLVAKDDLPAGSFIREENLRWQTWPDDTLDPNYMIEGHHDMTALVGAVVRRGIFAGEPVTEGQIARPGDRGFLAAVLKPGMRAVAISVNDTTGIAGLVFPGDRVDIILTHVVSNESGGSGREVRASETVLENVRVLAIDQILNDQDSEPNLANTATIELTPKQVEIIAVVTEIGRLSLSLRSLAKPELIDDGTVSAAIKAAARKAARTGNPTTRIEEIPEPERGRSFTRDAEVSRVIAGRNTVTVVNGGTITQVPVK